MSRSETMRIMIDVCLVPFKLPDRPRGPFGYHCHRVVDESALTGRRPRRSMRRCTSEPAATRVETRPARLPPASDESSQHYAILHSVAVY